MTWCTQKCSWEATPPSEPGSGKAASRSTSPTNSCLHRTTTSGSTSRVSRRGWTECATLSVLCTSGGSTERCPRDGGSPKKRRVMTSDALSEQHTGLASAAAAQTRLLRLPCLQEHHVSLLTRLGLLAHTVVERDVVFRLSAGGQQVGGTDALLRNCLLGLVALLDVGFERVFLHAQEVLAIGVLGRPEASHVGQGAAVLGLQLVTRDALLDLLQILGDPDLLHRDRVDHALHDFPAQVDAVRGVDDVVLLETAGEQHIRDLGHLFDHAHGSHAELAPHVHYQGPLLHLARHETVLPDQGEETEERTHQELQFRLGQAGFEFQGVHDYDGTEVLVSSAGVETTLLQETQHFWSQGAVGYVLVEGQTETDVSHRSSQVELATVHVEQSGGRSPPGRQSDAFLSDLLGDSGHHLLFVGLPGDVHEYLAESVSWHSREDVLGGEGGGEHLPGRAEGIQGERLPRHRGGHLSIQTIYVIYMSVQASQMRQASTQVPANRSINVNTILDMDSTELVKIHPTCLVSKNYRPRKTPPLMEVSSLQDTLQELIFNQGFPSRETFETHLDISEQFMTLGSSYLDKGDYPKAEKYILSAKQITEPLTTQNTQWKNNERWYSVRIKGLLLVIRLLTALKKHSQLFHILHHTIHSQMMFHQVKQVNSLILSDIDEVNICFVKMLFRRRQYKECVSACVTAMQIIDNLFTNIRQNEYSKKIFRHQYVIYNIRKRLNLVTFFEYLAKCLVALGNYPEALHFLSVIRESMQNAFASHDPVVVYYEGLLSACRVESQHSRTPVLFRMADHFKFSQKAIVTHLLIKSLNTMLKKFKLEEQLMKKQVEEEKRREIQKKLNNKLIFANVSTHREYQQMENLQKNKDKFTFIGELKNSVRSHYTGEDKLASKMRGSMDCLISTRPSTALSRPKKVQIESQQADRQNGASQQRQSGNSKPKLQLRSMRSQVIASNDPLLVKRTTSSFDLRLKPLIPALQFQKENLGPITNNFVSSEIIDESSKSLFETPDESEEMMQPSSEKKADSSMRSSVQLVDREDLMNKASLLIQRQWKMQVIKKMYSSQIKQLQQLRIQESNPDQTKIRHRQTMLFTIQKFDTERDLHTLVVNDIQQQYRQVVRGLQSGGEGRELSLESMSLFRKTRNFEITQVAESVERYQAMVFYINQFMFRAEQREVFRSDSCFDLTLLAPSLSEALALVNRDVCLMKGVFRQASRLRQYSVYIQDRDVVMVVFQGEQRHTLVRLGLLGLFQTLYGNNSMAAMVKLLFRSAQKKRFSSRILDYLLSQIACPDPAAPPPGIIPSFPKSAECPNEPQIQKKYNLNSVHKRQKYIEKVKEEQETQRANDQKAYTQLTCSPGFSKYVSVHFKNQRTFLQISYHSSEIRVSMTVYQPDQKRLHFLSSCSIAEIEKISSCVQNSRVRLMHLAQMMQYKSSLVGGRRVMHSDPKTTECTHDVCSPLVLLSRQDCHCLQQTYRTDTHQRVYPLKFIGQSMLHLTHFRSISSKTSRDQFFVLTLHPLGSRTNQFKALFTLDDLPGLSPGERPLQSQLFLNQLFAIFLKRIPVMKDKIYKRISLPTSAAKCKRQPFRVIYHKIVRSHGLYLVVTIKKSSLCSQWAIDIYCQRSSREFSCSLSMHDVSRFTRQFSSSCFPQNVIKNIGLIYQGKAAHITYQGFHKIYKSLMKRTASHNEYLQPGQEERIQRLRQQMTLRKSLTSRWTGDRPPPPQPAYKAIDLNLQPSNSQQEFLLETAIWDKVLSHLQLKRREQSLLLSIDTYSCLTREVMFEDTVSINGSQIFLQMKLQQLTKSCTNEIQEKFGSFRYYNSCNYVFYLKYWCFKRRVEMSQKINLRKVIYDYIHSTRPGCSQDIYRLDFNQADLSKMSTYLLHKIKNYLMSNSPEKTKRLEALSKVFIKKEVFTLDPENTKKLKINQQIDLVSDKEFKKIYQSVLCRRPLVLLVICYNYPASVFLLTLYDQRKSRVLEKRVSLAALSRIQSIEHLIEARLFFPLGQRIQSLLQNQLLEHVKSL